MKTDNEFEPETLKKYLRVFLITLDGILSRVKDEGGFNKVALSPRLAKIDPFDIDNFNCNMKFVKKERMDEITHSLFASTLSELNSNGKDLSNTVEVLSIFGRYLHNYGVNNMQSFKEGDKFLLITAFSHFGMESINKLKKKLSLTEDEVDILVSLFKRLSKSNSSSEEELRNIINDPHFEKFFKDEGRCIYNSTLNVTVSDDNFLFGTNFQYQLDWNGGFTVNSKEDFFNSIFFWTSNIGSTVLGRKKISEYLTIDESPLNLIDLTFRK